MMFLSCEFHRDWSNISSIIFYPNVDMFKVYHASDDSLSRFHAKSIDYEKMIVLLKKSKIVHKIGYLWKGEHLAMIKFTHGKKTKLLISVYGGFFLDISTNTFFEIPKDQRGEWDDLIGSNLRPTEYGFTTRNK